MLKKVLSGIKQTLLIATLPSLFLWSCESPPIEEIQQNTTTEQKQDDTPVVKFEQAKPINGQYIVVFKEGVFENPSLESRTQAEFEEITFDPSVGRSQVFKPEAAIKVEAEMKEEAIAVLKEHHIASYKIKNVFSSALHGVTAQLEISEVEALNRDDRVLYVEEDQVVALGVLPLIKTPIIPSSKGENSQYTPYGIKHVGGSKDMSNDMDKAFKWAWIVDSGIDIDHEDLDVNTYYAADFTSDNTVDDLHGHGTHVAGIIGAKNNSYGVTGVAAGATVVPIKVLNRYGEGSYSDVVAALDHIYRYMLRGDVVNLSIGGGVSSAIDDAVRRVANRGVRVVIAAGNSSRPISEYSPARIEHSKVFTVGATGWFGLFAWFNNYGSQMDCVAPGVGILSTYKDNKYGYLGGTSMAAPHAAGVLLVSPNSYYFNGSTYTKSGYVGKIHH